MDMPVEPEQPDAAVKAGNLMTFIGTKGYRSQTIPIGAQKQKQYVYKASSNCTVINKNESGTRCKVDFPTLEEPINTQVCPLAKQGASLSQLSSSNMDSVGISEEQEIDAM